MITLNACKVSKCFCWYWKERIECRLKVKFLPHRERSQIGATLACEKNKQEHSQLHTPPGCSPMSLSEVHPLHWLTLKDLLGTAVTIHWVLSQSHAPVTVFVLAIFCFVFFLAAWYHWRHTFPQKEFSCPTMWFVCLFVCSLAGKSRLAGESNEKQCC
jgi:hypothetical protein